MVLQEDIWLGQDMADGLGGLGFWSFRRLSGLGHDMADNFGSSVLWSFGRLFSLIEEESRWGDICLIELSSSDGESRDCCWHHSG